MITPANPHQQATHHEVVEAIEEMADRLVAMVAGATDLHRPVPGSPDWTVIEAFAHVVTDVPRFEQGPQGEGEWTDAAADLPDLNGRKLDLLPTRDPQELASRLKASLGSLTATIDRFGDDQPSYAFHGGAPVRADSALGILLGEFVVHGHDIASALGEPWPIEPRHASLILDAVSPILPGWLDPARSAGHTATYELRLRGQGSHVYAFTDGRLEVDPPDRRRIDVHISGSPVATLLVLYGRTSQWPAIRRGQILAWGRKPWLAFTFTHRFHTA